MKRCPICGGTVETKTITYPQDFKGRIIVLANVPAEVCRQCGEVLLTPTVLERVQAIVWGSKLPQRTVQVPVYDLAEAG